MATLGSSINHGSFSNSSNFSSENRTLKIEELLTHRQIWYKWLLYRIRSYMLIEGILVLVVVFLLSNAYEVKLKNVEMFELISNLENRIEKMEQRSGLKPNSSKIDEDNSNVQDFFTTKAPDEPTTEIPSFTTEPTPTFTPAKQTQISMKLSSLFNVASYLNGALVDISQSSGSNLTPMFGKDQSNLIILDRPDPPPSKVWCSTDNQPVLVITLAKPTKPIYVSYQHFYWRKFVPSGAPRTYNVSGCVDIACEKKIPLAQNCEYKSSYRQLEQFCQLRTDIPELSKIQFKFLTNYGNRVETCVSLVRVYEKSKNVNKDKERTKKEIETCYNQKFLKTTKLKNNFMPRRNILINNRNIRITRTTIHGPLNFGQLNDHRRRPRERQPERVPIQNGGAFEPVDQDVDQHEEVEQLLGVEQPRVEPVLMPIQNGRAFEPADEDAHQQEQVVQHLQNINEQHLQNLQSTPVNGHRRTRLNIPISPIRFDLDEEIRGAEQENDEPETVAETSNEQTMEAVRAGEASNPNLSLPNIASNSPSIRTARSPSPAPAPPQMLIRQRRPTLPLAPRRLTRRRVAPAVMVMETNRKKYRYERGGSSN